MAVRPRRQGKAPISVAADQAIFVGRLAPMGSPRFHILRHAMRSATPLVHPPPQSPCSVEGCSRSVPTCSRGSPLGRVYKSRLSSRLTPMPAISAPPWPRLRLDTAQLPRYRDCGSLVCDRGGGSGYCCWSSAGSCCGSGSCDCGSGGSGSRDCGSGGSGDRDCGSG